MDIDILNGKKSFYSSILKKVDRYLSLTKGGRAILSKSKSWHSSSTTRRASTNKVDEKRKEKNQMTPEGCFSVYVGQEKERFAIKTKYANHPLFKMLLEDAETEYGYNSQGPILLPCHVDFFYNVLAEIDCSKEMIHPKCGFAYGSCSPLFSPARRLGNGEMSKVYGSYGTLIPPRILKLNHL